MATRETFARTLGAIDAIAPKPAVQIEDAELFSCRLRYSQNYLSGSQLASAAEPTLDVRLVSSSSTDSRSAGDAPEYSTGWFVLTKNASHELFLERRPRRDARVTDLALALRGAEVHWKGKGRFVVTATSEANQYKTVLELMPIGVRKPDVICAEQMYRIIMGLNEGTPQRTIKDAQNSRTVAAMKQAVLEKDAKIQLLEDALASAIQAQGRKQLGQHHLDLQRRVLTAQMSTYNSTIANSIASTQLKGAESRASRQEDLLRDAYTKNSELMQEMQQIRAQTVHLRQAREDAVQASTQAASASISLVMRLGALRSSLQAEKMHSAINTWRGVVRDHTTLLRTHRKNAARMEAFRKGQHFRAWAQEARTRQAALLEGVFRAQACFRRRKHRRAMKAVRGAFLERAQRGETENKELQSRMQRIAAILTTDQLGKLEGNDSPTGVWVVAARRYAERTLSNAMQVWKQQAKSQGRNARVMRRFVARYRDLCVAAAFEAWIESIGRRRRAVRMISKWRNRALSAYFQTWEVYVRQIKEERDIESRLEHVQVTMREKTVQWMFARKDEQVLLVNLARWRAWCAANSKKTARERSLEQKRRERTVLFRTVARLNGVALSSAFDTWARFAERKREVEKHSGRLRMATSTYGTQLERWRKVNGKLKRELEMTEGVLGRTRRELSSANKKLQELSKSSAKLKLEGMSPSPVRKRAMTTFATASGAAAAKQQVADLRVSDAASYEEMAMRYRFERYDKVCHVDLRMCDALFCI